MLLDIKKAPKTLQGIEWLKSLMNGTGLLKDHATTP
jgi:hypothetical protein